MISGSYCRNNTYDELKVTVLGSYYSSDYFRFITNDSIRDPLMRIADEINEDLDTFEKVLRQHGTRVIRPLLPTVDQFVEHHQSTGQFLMPPIQPRDCHSVVGDRIYKLNPQHESNQFVDDCVINYNQEHLIELSDKNTDFYHRNMAQAQACHNAELDIWYCRNKYLELAGPDWPRFEDYVQGARSSHPFIQKELEQFASDLCYESKEVHWLEGPNVLPVDDRIVVDCNEYCDYAAWVREHMNIGSCEVTQITTKSSHTDGCFVILGQKTILGIDPLIDYSKHFPDYHVIGVPAESYQNRLDEFLIMKNCVDGRWWVPGEEHNEDFINFVELYLREWTGHVYETVFDVNVLALNPETVCVSNYNPDIFSKLQQRGIEPVIVPWRHRFFVDCGLHCLTLDLHRGNML
jgi:hypothetical protein